MTDPTIQMFCCYHNHNGSFMSKVIAKDFDTRYYNVLCLISSMFGICGALYQIWPKKYDANYQHYWGSGLQKIIRYLSIGDLMASIGIFIRASFWFATKSINPMFGDYSNMLICVFTSAWIQYFYTTTWIWTLCYAIDMYYLFRNTETHRLYYHFCSWVLPAIFTLIGLTLLYIPNANCHAIDSLKSAITHILPNYLLTYIPLLVIMLVNPFLYYGSINKLEEIIVYRFGQITNRERLFTETIRSRFTFVCIIFYFCWISNVIIGFLLWIYWSKLPPSIIVNLWYTSACLNPLQALFNCFVYRRKIYSSERFLIPYRRIIDSNSDYDYKCDYHKYTACIPELRPINTKQVPKYTATM